MNVDSYTFTRRFGRAKLSYSFDNSVSKSKFLDFFLRIIVKCFEENIFKEI